VSFLRAERERERERVSGEGEVRHIIRITPELMIKYLEDVLYHDEKILKRAGVVSIHLRSYLDIIKEVAIRTMSDPMSIVPVADKETFFRAVVNRILLALKSLREVVEDKTNTCIDLISWCGSHEVECKNDVKTFESVDGCRQFLNSIEYVGVLGLQIAEAMFSLVQFSVPIDMQPNTVKMLAGYQSD